MAATQIFTLANVVLAAAPPMVHLPNDAGIAIPVGKTAWDLAIDLGGTVPSGQDFGVGIEYLIDGVWQPDAGATMTTGSYTPKSGVPTTVNHLSSSIGAHDSNGNLVGSYPARARARIDLSGNWTLPSVTLTLT